MRCSFVWSFFVILAISATLRAEDAPRLTLCLAPAADGSPVYPLKTVPATNREMMIAFRLLPGESFETLTDIWTVLDVGEVAPPNTEIGRGEVKLGSATTGTFKYTLPRDLPVGKYRLDALGDGKPWASLEFAVTEAVQPAPLAKPADLLPLEPGTSWTYSWVLEPGPAAKTMTVAGAEKGDDGLYRTTTTLGVAAKEDSLARIEMRRSGKVVSEEWWSLTDRGLAVTKVRGGAEPAPYDPPLPMIALPLQSPATWTHHPADGSAEVVYRMWGPLPVQAPAGEMPGWIVWMRTVTDNQVSTIERHYAPGIGVVREVHVSAVGPALLMRIETALLSGK